MSDEMNIKGFQPIKAGDVQNGNYTDEQKKLLTYLFENETSLTSDSAKNGELDLSELEKAQDWLKTTDLPKNLGPLEQALNILKNLVAPKNESKNAPYEGKTGVTTDENGNSTVTIQPWKSSAIGDNAKPNDCLWNIWVNYYKDSGAKWDDFKNAAVAANPSIYNSGRSTLKGSKDIAETILRDGDKLNLPDMSKINNPKPAETSSNRTGNGNRGSSSTPPPKTSSGGSSIADEIIEAWNKP